VIALPAVDLKDGAVVQLVGGRPEAERIRLADPVAVARGWVEAGFRALHVVDLDAALGTGSNRAIVEAILAAVDVPVQVGGGIRDDDAAEALLTAGAARIIAGTRAVEDAAWIEALAERHPGRVIVAADVRGDVVVTRGWTTGAGITVDALFARLEPLPLAGLLVTDVGREGRMAGIDAARFEALAAATRHPLIAAGGIASMDDLRALASRGVAGAVLGMALYTGAVDARTAAREFAGPGLTEETTS
jgi:phosphoribosylformimino-5-aminoimidazole carboxamide ribotide isomerase